VHTTPYEPNNDCALNPEKCPYLNADGYSKLGLLFNNAQNGDKIGIMQVKGMEAFWGSAT
jgi:hypothetical protein